VGRGERDVPVELNSNGGQNSRLIERECRSGPLWEIDGLPLDCQLT